MSLEGDLDQLLRPLVIQIIHSLLRSIEMENERFFSFLKRLSSSTQKRYETISYHSSSSSLFLTDHSKESKYH